MKFSVFLMGTRNGSYFDIVDQVRDAEKLGFRGVWLAERTFTNGDLLWPSPMVAASYLAASTRRIRIGLAARILPFHHPIHVASDAATLDVLTSGRLDLGLSRSSMDDTPYRVFGVSRQEATERFDESFGVLRAALRGERLTNQGRYFDVDGVTLSPKPIQKPHPPIYMIANSPAAVDACAKDGLPIFVHGAHRIDGVQEVLSRYRTVSSSAGFENRIDTPVNRFVYVAATTSQARRFMERPFMDFLAQRAPDLRACLEAKYGADAAKSFDFIADEIGIFGDPEYCIARLRDLRDRAGLRHVLCTFNLITLDHDACVESMNRFAAFVMPKLEREDRIRVPRALLGRLSERRPAQVL
jgi:alkanesulfonate monooxygenase SsuD/methylene tetrahydromethanopterin reductase-like flavin-dependent oxidoreductase (luciferase family)